MVQSPKAVASAGEFDYQQQQRGWLGIVPAIPKIMTFSANTASPLPYSLPKTTNSICSRSWFTGQKIVKYA